jgi:hypothetical protein
MGRTFEFDLMGRHLSIRPMPVDEGWELWVMEGNTRLWLGGRVSVDDAVVAGRDGRDSVLIAVEQVKRRLMSPDSPFADTHRAD